MTEDAKRYICVRRDPCPVFERAYSLGPTDSHWTDNGCAYHWSGRLDLEELRIMKEWTNEDTADFWHMALRDIEDADAKEERLYPLSSSRPRNHLIHEAAWLQYVRDHPQTSAEDWQRVCDEIGITLEQHEIIRSRLTRRYTQRNGYLIADYPWFDM